ncbi:MAG TPA: HAD family phosphatase [Anaerolineales bacterium]|jgi:putative hydrolase of the HAD superfamily
MTIKAIYFDLGGVIVRTDNKSSRKSLAAEFGMSYAEMDNFVFESQAAALASIGKLTEEQHWLDVTRRLNLPDTDMPRIRDAFFGGDDIDLALVDLLRSLRRTHKTGLISNAWDGLRPWIIDRKFDDAFDYMTISSEVGFAKPDARIYQFALEKLGVEPGQAVFVDDIEENVAGAQALGMHGLLFQSSEQTLAAIKQMLDG